MGIPQKDGTVANFSFKPGTLTDFNNYVADIQSAVSKDQQAARQAQQNADLNKQLSDVENKINTENAKDPGKYFESLEQLKLELDDYVHWFNHKRIHGTLGYLSPIDYKKEHLKKVA